MLPDQWSANPASAKHLYNICTMFYQRWTVVVQNVIQMLCVCWERLVWYHCTLFRTTRGEGGGEFSSLIWTYLEYTNLCSSTPPLCHVQRKRLPIHYSSPHQPNGDHVKGDKFTMPVCFSLIFVTLGGSSGSAVDRSPGESPISFTTNVIPLELKEATCHLLEWEREPFIYQDKFS